MPFDVETPDKLEYNFYPVKGKSLKFKVKAAHDAHVALTTGPFDGNPMYEIFIGGWGNSKTALRRNKEKPDVATAETPNILTGDAVKEFSLSWEENKVALCNCNDPGNPLLVFTENDPFEITHFGIRTGWGATGSWIVDDEWSGYQINQSPVETKAPPGGEGPWKWVFTSGNEIPPNALKGGFDNEDLYVGRAHHVAGGVIPGKVLVSHGVCYFSWGGEEHSMSEYEVLCDCHAEWVPSSEGEVPPGAVPGGVSEDGETLYVGRVNHQDTTTLGKIHCSHKSCYIPYGGEEIGYSEYEVLVGK